MKHVSRILPLLFFLVSVGFGWQEVKLPVTEAGKQVAAYIKAFNSGDAKEMRSFFETYAAKKTPAKATIEQRLERYRQMNGRMGTLALKKVFEATEAGVTVLATSSNGGMLRLEFEFEPDAPHGFLGLAVDQAENEDPAAPRAENDAQLVTEVAKLLNEQVAANEFSGVVLIMKNDSALFSNAYGYADVEKKISNNFETKFNIGSINKAFTTLAIHQLAAQGKLSMADPISKYLPEYPNKDTAGKVTIRHLLDMSSGIGDIFGQRFEATPKEKLKTIRDYIPLFADQALAFEPGTQQRYSNGGFIVLGAIIEAVAGVDYYTYVHDNIFAKAGMMQTASFAKDEVVANRATGYTREAPGGVRLPNTAGMPGRGSSAGGGYSTAGDLLRYTRALATSDIAPPNYEQRQGMGIAGGAPGINAALEWNPRAGYTVIVLSNYDPPSAERVARSIRGLLPKPNHR